MQTDHNQVPTAPGTGRTIVWVGILMFGVAVGLFELAAIANTVPHLLVEFDTTPAGVSWVMTANILVAGVSAAIGGRLGDAYGRRRVFAAALVASGVGSLISLITGSLEGIIVGRAFQGLAGACVPIAVGIVCQVLSGPRVKIAIGAVMVATTLGGSAGALVGGILVDRQGWESVFVVSLVISLAAAAACVALPKSLTKTRAARLDYIGGLLFALGVCGIMYGITQSSAWGWTDTRTLSFIATGMAILLLCVVWELKISYPLLDLRLYANRQMGLVLLLAACLSFGPTLTFQFVFFLIMQSPKDAPVGLGLSATDAGLVALIPSIVAFGSSYFISRLASHIGGRAIAMLGSITCVAAGITAMTLFTTLAGVLICAVAFGVAFGFQLNCIPFLVEESVPAGRTSEAVGVTQLITTMCGAIGTSLFASVLSSSVVPGTPFSTHSAYVTVFALTTIACAVGLPVAALLSRNRARSAGIEDRPLDQSTTAGMAVPPALQ